MTMPRIRSGFAPPTKLKSLTLTASICSKTLFCFCQSRKLAGEGLKRGTSGSLVSHNYISLSWSLYGYGRSSTAFTTLKIAVFAPIPNASVSAATAVKPGLLRSVRRL